MNKPKPLPRMEIMFKGCKEEDGEAAVCKALGMLVKYYAEENCGDEGERVVAERICDVLFEKQLKKMQSVIE